MSRYAVITPVRDEAEGLERLAACMADQATRPDPWILVENGSTDGTPDVCARLSKEQVWIRALTMSAAPASERGAPIVAAFHHGIASIDEAVPVVGQLDADLTFDADYWQRLLDALGDDERLGIVSGTCLELHDGRWQERFGTGASVWGAARLYRRACLDEVLPLEPRTGWDAIDVAVANARGWETRVLRDVPFRHHRREGSREQSLWSSWTAQGRVSHFLGYRPSYLAIRAAFKSVRDPAALGLLGGYANEAFHRRPRCARPGVVAWVRAQQRWRALGRRAAEARGRVGAAG